MTEYQTAQLAAIRERYRESDCKTYAYTVIHADHEQARKDARLLLRLLADAERRADEIEHDSDILLGVEWQRSVKAANGDPEAAREHRIAALVAELAEANERAEQAADARQAEIVGWLRMQADRGDKHIDEHGLDRHTHPSTVQAISTMRTTADAIERGEFRGKS